MSRVSGQAGQGCAVKLGTACILDNCWLRSTCKGSKLSVFLSLSFSASLCLCVCLSLSL
jgi:hypothetical protein